MNLEKKDLLKKIGELFDSDGTLMALATSEENVPCVRYMIGHMGENLRVSFATYRGSRKVKQIEKNPVVCFVVGGDPSDWRKPYARFTGICREVRDPKEREKLWKPIYKSFFSGPDDENLALFVIEPARVEYADPANDVAEVVEFSALPPK